MNVIFKGNFLPENNFGEKRGLIDGCLFPVK